MKRGEGDELAPVIHVVVDFGLPLGGPEVMVAVVDYLTLPESDDRRDGLGNVQRLHGATDGAVLQVKALDNDIDAPFIGALCLRGGSVDGLRTGESLADGEEGGGAEPARGRGMVMVLAGERIWRGGRGVANQHGGEGRGGRKGRCQLGVEQTAATRRGGVGALQRGEVGRGGGWRGRVGLGGVGGGLGLGTGKKGRRFAVRGRRKAGAANGGIGGAGADAAVARELWGAQTRARGGREHRCAFAARERAR
ncbi:hypothetical protein FGB62_51g127 [Gracilaria domingensis]|nr:hypothetical protein FGB62_51g127 [Gracilaria domingensis]